MFGEFAEKISTNTFYIFGGVILSGFGAYGIFDTFVLKATTSKEVTTLAKEVTTLAEEVEQLKKHQKILIKEVNEATTSKEVTTLAKEVTTLADEVEQLKKHQKILIKEINELRTTILEGSNSVLTRPDAEKLANVILLFTQQELREAYEKVCLCRQNTPHTYCKTPLPPLEEENPLHEWYKVLAMQLRWQNCLKQRHTYSDPGKLSPHQSQQKSYLWKMPYPLLTMCRLPCHMGVFLSDGTTTLEGSNSVLTRPNAEKLANALHRQQELRKAYEKGVPLNNAIEIE